MPESILRGAVARAALRLHDTRVAIGTLSFYYRRPDPDIDDRVDAALDHIARAFDLLEALSDDLAEWERQADHAEETD